MQNRKAGRNRRPVEFIGSSQKDLRAFPDPIRYIIGKALGDAEESLNHRDAKPLKGFGGVQVMEIVADDDGDAYRAVYTTRFADVIYVLHVFQKKSKRGVKTPIEEMRLVRSRLKEAIRLHENRPS